MLEQDFEKMRAEMDRIEQWIARRADQASLALIRKESGEISWPKVGLLFVAWALIFIALPAWLLGGF